MSNANAPNRNYPETLEDLAAKLAALFVAQEGMTPEQAAARAFLCAELIRREWGGQTVYIPLGSSYNVQKMAVEIFRRWHRANTRELCKEFGITERRLAQLASIGREIALAQNQLRLAIEEPPDDPPA